MVLPVHDVNPSRRAPVVTYLLITINFVAFVLSPLAVAPLVASVACLSRVRGNPHARF